MKEEKTLDPQPQVFELKTRKNALLVGIFRSGTEREVCDDNLKELERLCDTYGLKVATRVSCPIKKIDVGTYLG
jgi:hypothetical protein